MRAKFAAKYPRAAKIRLFIVEKHFDPKAKFRDVAWYQPDVHAVYFLKRALRLSRNTLLGLSAHEIGHGCRSDDCEQCADDTAEGTLGRNWIDGSPDGKVPANMREDVFADGRVAYSGSPLPYSFSEERHHKSVSIVELGPDGAATVDRVRLDVGMNVRSRMPADVPCRCSARRYGPRTLNYSGCSARPMRW